MPILNTQRVYNSATYVIDYDPSDLGGEGLVAGLNSVATLSPGGEVFVKTGLGDYDWTLVVAGAGPASPWIQNGSNIYFNSGNVGIGLTDPQYPLDVNGEGNFNGRRIIGVANPDPLNNSGVVTVGYADTHYAPAGGSYANQNLSNLLANTAVNVDLLPQDDNTQSLGDVNHRFLNGYIYHIHTFDIAAPNGLTIDADVTDISLYGANIYVNGQMNMNNANKIVNLVDGSDPQDAVAYHQLTDFETSVDRKSTRLNSSHT